MVQMDVHILYCGGWGYEKEALRVRDRLVDKFSANVAMEKGDGGIFNVTVNGVQKFVIHEVGHFPTDEEIDSFNL